MLLVVATTLTKAGEDGQAGLIPDLCNQTHPSVVLQMSQATINNLNIRVELEKKEKLDSPCNSSLPATVTYTPLLGKPSFQKSAVFLNIVQKAFVVEM